ncbi:MAG: hypothetical protein PHX27_03180 [Candidatus ainarchaeum sp.]|nr:hypothetical protein [Candidatus ainarchaeum sp.]
MKKEFVLITGCVSFVVLVISLSLLLADKFQVPSCGCPNMVSHNFIGIFVVLSVIFVSCLSFYLFSLKIDNKEKIIKSNIEVLYSILDVDEKNLIDKLVKNNGLITQPELSKIYGKLKSHRLIKKLEEKNIVVVNRSSKTNIVELNNALKQGLIK